jgi:tetratricopeptide (TPR) repeat protein
MKKLILYALGFLLLAGCVVTEPVNIHVLYPAQITIPASINKVVFINHSIRFNEQTNKIFGEDSLLSTSYFIGLANTLHSSPRFELISDTAIAFYKPSKSKFAELDTSTIRTIIDTINADAAIILENYQVIYDDPIKIEFSPEYGYYSTFSVQNNSLWKVYDISNKRFLDDYLLKDTLFWDASSPYQQEIFKQLPELETALIQSCYYAGMKYAQRIAQIWNEEQRYFIIPDNNDFYKALSFVKNNEWQKAIEIWKKYAYGKNRRLAAAASFDMAILSEMLDNIDAALDWAAKSYLIKPDDNTEKYIKILEKRQKDKEIIFRQNNF